MVTLFENCFVCLAPPISADHKSLVTLKMYIANRKNEDARYVCCVPEEIYHLDWNPL